MDTGTGTEIELTEGETINLELPAGIKTKTKSRLDVKLLTPGPVTGKIKTDRIQQRYELHIIPAAAVEQPVEVPGSVALKQNYPNPFNPATVIEYEVPEEAAVRLEVFDMLGQKVATLVDEQKAAGSYNVSFDAGGLHLASGLYMYRLSVDNWIHTKKNDAAEMNFSLTSGKME